MVDAREYHERTNHSPESVRRDSFRLDRSNQPRPYKTYEDLPRVEPAGEPTPPAAPALSAVATARPDPERGDGSDGDRPDGPDLHALCYYATGVTKELTRRGRTIPFRAAACTGKLYHVDLYAVVGDVPGFDPGIYHYDPATDAFDVLREGEYRGVLAGATGGEAGVTEAPVTFVVTSEWWRNAWKYRERTYRHAFWDSGTILANLLAAAHGAGHRAAVVTAFADDPVARLVGVDPGEQAPLELVPVGAGDPVPDDAAGPGDVDPIDPAERPLSDEVVEYPLVPDAWRQSRLADGETAREWREDLADCGDDGPFVDARDGRGGAPHDSDTVALDPVDADTASARPVGNTIERRGSLREYAREPVSARKLATVLDRALRGVPADAFGPDRRLVEPYVLVHAVEGVPGGAYRYRPAADRLERVGDADRETAGHLALDQPVVGDAAVNVYLVADVERIVERAGNRGYRLAQLAGGVALGRLYLATYAHRRLGGRGFTFYDDLVAEYLTGGRATPMTLFAFGKRPDSG